jgi:hypothetical protein
LLRISTTASWHTDAVGGRPLHLQKARDWIAKNAAETGASAPTVTEGAVILHLK